MRDAAPVLALAGLLLAGVMTAMLAGLVLLWVTSCKEAPPERPTTTSTVFPTTTTVAPEPPEAPLGPPD